MMKNPPRGVEYRARAAAELAAGAATILDQVRAKHDKAAQVWTDLADAEDARAADRAERAEAAELRLAAAT